MAQQTIGLVRTERPVPYMKQLCRHFQHKLEVSFDDDSGRIEFPSATCQLRPVSAGLLQIEVEAGTEADLDRAKDVVKRHLERFGRRDSLELEWQ